MEVEKFLKKKGHVTIGNSWYEKIDLWNDWYKGHVSAFHDYRQYNGNKILKRTRKSLRLAKQVAEDKADLLMNEKVKINLGDDKSQQRLGEILDSNNFYVKSNQLVELTAALGTGAFVQYLENGAVRMDYMRAPTIYPLSWRNGQIIECAFVSAYNMAGKELCSVSVHRLVNGYYWVENYLANDKGEDVGLPPGVAPVFYTQSRTPLFQIIMPNIANNIDPDNPMGVSVYANAVDNLEGIDLVYDSYLNEFRLGKKRIIVDSTATRISMDDGTFKPVFDDNDTEFYGMDMQEADKSIVEINMELRAEPHEKALQTGLNLLSQKVGLGPNYYEWDGSKGIKTATEVISENSQLFRTLKKDEIILRKALMDMARSVAHLENTFLQGSLNVSDISIAFDDSIIEDTEAIAKRAFLELGQRVIDRVKYLQRVYGYTEAQAIKEIQEVDARSPVTQDVDFYSESDGE